MHGFDEYAFFNEAKALHKKIDYEKRLDSLESILVFERKWQGHFTAIKGAAAAVQHLYLDIIITYLFFSEELTAEEEEAFDLLLEDYADVGLVDSGKSFIL